MTFAVLGCYTQWGQSGVAITMPNIAFGVRVLAKNGRHVTCAHKPRAPSRLGVPGDE